MNKIYFSSLFVKDYPKIYKKLKNILKSDCGKISYTKDYWVRDFMPIKIGENRLVKFIYNPDYLQDKKNFISDVDKILEKNSFAKNCEIKNLPLVLDGGNLVFCDDFLVMTEKVFAENPNFSKTEIENFLKEAFENPNLKFVWLPWDKKEIFGHADGIVKFLGKNFVGKPKVLVNLKVFDDEIATKMYDKLAENFEVVELKLSEYDELSWAYINCLQTEKCVIVPGIGNFVTDTEVLEQYKKLLPDSKVCRVQMRDFIAENGGALNCLSWGN